VTQKKKSFRGCASHKTGLGSRAHERGLKKRHRRECRGVGEKKTSHFHDTRRKDDERQRERGEPGEFAEFRQKKKARTKIAKVKCKRIGRDRGQDPKPGTTKRNQPATKTSKPLKKRGAKERDGKRGGAAAKEKSNVEKRHSFGGDPTN